MDYVPTPLPAYSIPGRYLRWAMVLALFGLLVWVLFTAFSAIIPFLLAFLLAVIFGPGVGRIERLLPWRSARPRLARITAILTLYVVVAGVLVGVGFLLVPTIADEVQQLIEDAPTILDDAEGRLQGVSDWFEEHVPKDVRDEVTTRVSDVGSLVGDWLLDAVAGVVGTVVGSTFTIVGYFAIPFFLFYLLKDRGRLRPWLLQLFPPSLQADAEVVLHSTERTVSQYLRAQLFLGVLIGLVIGIGLWIMGVQFPAALGLVAGITELIPFIGPFLGFLPAFVVVLATDPDKWWWIVLFYLAVQQLEGQILVPQIQGRAVLIHPAAVMALVVIGGALFGIAGMLVIVPVAAVIRNTFVYVYRRLNGELPAPGTLPPDLLDPPPEAPAPFPEATPPALPNTGAAL